MSTHELGVGGVPGTGDAVSGTGRRSLRLWPGVVIVALQWLVRFGLPLVAPESIGIAVGAGALGGLALIVWWLFFSRAPWLDRVAAVVVAVLAVIATLRLQVLHPSIAGGMMGLMFPIYVVPVLSLALVAWAAVCQALPAWPRRAALVASLVAACAVFALLRTNGLSGAGRSDLAWRWSESAEERLLATAAERPVAPATAPVVEGTEAEWPGFRGPGRDGVVHGLRVATDWSVSPPVELWRRAIGPGWSSFAVRGDVLYTQEQRGDDEAVSAYRVSTGEPVWSHTDAVRFWESNAGAGPRGTPTLADERVVTFGATGILNVLAAADGSVVWTRDVVADTAVETPGWGFASSPLVVGDTVFVGASGELVAYDLASGALRWRAPDRGESYSSPQLLVIDGVPQVLLLANAGLEAFSREDGAPLWQFQWPGFASLQPEMYQGDVLIGNGGVTGGNGVRRLAVGHGAGGWSVEERWLSTGLKPYFNDLVVHRGHAYGFDGRILSCIDLQTGERRWKGGRYGNGQMLLLADAEVLLVLSEHGDLALVAATPEQFTELARVPALDGKTWNHPAVVGDVVLLRNDREMAAFRLPSGST